MTRNLEIIKDKGNVVSRFTVTPDRLTIKIAEHDLVNESKLVELGLKTAEQIPSDMVSLRGKVLLDQEFYRLDNKEAAFAKRIEYTFESATGDLVGVKDKSE